MASRDEGTRAVRRRRIGSVCWSTRARESGDKGCDGGREAGAGGAQWIDGGGVRSRWPRRGCSLRGMFAGRLGAEKEGWLSG